MGTNLELDFKQCSFHHIMQVLRVYSFSTFSLPPAFPPCSCSLAFRHQVRRLTSRISSESYPGTQECIANCHGAGAFTWVHPTIHPSPISVVVLKDTSAPHGFDASRLAVGPLSGGAVRVVTFPHISVGYR